LRAQCLGYQLRERELADLQVVRGGRRLLEDVHLDDLRRLDHDLDLHRAVGGVGDVPGDRAPARRNSGGGLGAGHRLLRRCMGFERQQRDKAGHRRGDG